MKQYIFTKMSQQNQQNQPQKQQQQQPRKKPAAAEWSMDLTSICGDGNGQNALKLKKLERLSMALCLLMTIMCGTLFYGIFVHSSNPLNPAKIWAQKDNGTLHQKIHECQSKIVQMLDDANAQKALETVHLQTIDKLSAIVEKLQAKEKEKWQPVSSVGRPGGESLVKSIATSLYGMFNCICLVLLAFSCINQWEHLRHQVEFQKVQRFQTVLLIVDLCVTLLFMVYHLFTYVF